jgi:3-hydroxyisobutyrate dehydrogenase-like beta-hydroxyacid dehydrogenase
MKVGFIALGRMGQGMAGRILSGGHDLVLYDPIPDNTVVLAKAGAGIAESIAAVAMGRDVVISMLPHDASLDLVVNGDDGLLASLSIDTVHMAMGTHSIDQIRQVENAHKAAGQTFIAAPVLGRPDLAADGLISIVPAGPAAAIEKMRPLFELMSKQIFPAGEKPESSTAVKIANNFMLGCAIENMGEAFALVRKMGVEPELFLEVLTKGLFSAPAYVVYGSMIANQNWDSYGATAVIGLKDAELVISAGKSADMELPSVNVWREHLASAIERGEGHLDWAVMAKEQARKSGLE